MGTMKILIFISFILVGWNPSAANVYYFANNGNDSNDGTSAASAWCSLKKLSDGALRFAPGDSLLFECGSIFKGQILISTSGLYLGAYGVGAKPIISGAIELNNWVAKHENIWRTDCPNDAAPANLFLDKIAQPLGRYPNKGYLTISGTSQSERTVTDTSHVFVDGYWNNAEIVVRSSRWTIDVLGVKEYSHKSFWTTMDDSMLPSAGYGYFIQSHLSTLDQPGEWFYQPASKQIYLFLKPGANPMSLKVTVSVLDAGLRIANAENIVIDHLAFEGQRLAGIIVNNGRNISLQDVAIRSSGKNGLEMINTENPCVVNSDIINSNNNGVEWHNNTGGIFSHNIIEKTGLRPGRGGNGDGNYIGLNITADQPQDGRNLFEYNKIDSTGYIGIDFRTGNTIIKNNNISNFCLTKDDGGGIYTWQNTLGYNIVENNTIANGVGTGEGTMHPTELYANGVYIDDRSSHILVKNNIIHDCATSGIFLHNAKVITLIGNQLFENGNVLSNKEKGQLYIRTDTLGQFGGNYDLQLEVIGNKMMASDVVSYCVYLSADAKRHMRHLGTFTQNEFTAGRSQQAVAELYHDDGLCMAPVEYNLEEWQRESGYEQRSFFRQLISNGSFDMLGDNLISNGTMVSNTNGWMVWPEPVSIVTDEYNGDESPALKVIFPAGSTEALLYHEGFSLKKDRLYKLSFSAKSLHDGKLEFAPLMANSPWRAVGDYTCFSIGSSNKAFTYYFRPEEDCLSARINFKGNAGFWIDNVSLFEILGTTVTQSGHF